MSRATGLADGKWIEVQKRVFTRWANAYLRTKKLKVDDIATDFSDGIKLIALLEVLNKEPFPYKYKAEPKMRIHKLENLKFAFNWMTDKGLKMVNVGANDVADCNEKIILGLMWSIISHFMVGEISLDGVSGKEGLLLWCQRNTAGYDNVAVEDFSKSWTNGLAFCALIHKYRPDVMPYAELTEEDPAKNLALAFAAAEDYFGIDRILDVEDIVDSAKPDEKIVLTYVAFFFKGFADFLRRQGLAKSIAKAIDISKRHDEWIAQYDAAAAELRAWLDSTTEAYGSRSHGNTAAAVRVTLDAFYRYKSDDKPAQKAAWGNLEGLYQTFSSSARNNNRPQYTPAAGLSVADLGAAWKALEEVENEYELHVRTTYDRFLVLENTLATVDLKVAKLNAWLDAQDATFAGESFGTSLTTVETLLDAFTAYEGQLAHFKEVAGLLHTMLTTNGCEEHADQPARVEAYNAAMEKLAATEESGAAYAQQLHMSKERFEKFAALDTVDSWMDSTLALFAAQNYGDSLAEVNQLLEDFKAFAVTMAPHKAVLDGMTSEQSVITDRIAEEREKMATTESQADVYRTYLLLAQEKFEKFAMLDKVSSWCTAQRNVFAAEDYGDTLSAVSALLDAFATFDANVNKRKELVTGMTSEQDVVMTRVAEVLELLAATESEGSGYHDQLLLSKERLEKLPVLDKLDAWCVAQKAIFAAGQYGDTLAAVSTLVEQYELFAVSIAPKKEQLAGMSSEQDIIKERLAAVAANVAETEEAAAAYHAQLLLAQERLEKLPVLAKVEGWLGVQNALFEAAEYGDSLVAVGTLQRALDAGYKVQLASHKDVLGAMTSEQAVITERLASVQATLAATEEAAAGYQAGLDASREQHQHLVDLIKTYNSKATELVFDIDDLGEELREPILSNSVSAVEASIAKFNDVIKARMDALTELYNQVDAWARELLEAGVEEAFERYTLQDLYDKYIAVYEAMSARDEELQALLAEEQGKDALRVEFANLAQAVSAYCDAQSKACGELAGSLEEQAAGVKAMQEEYAASSLLADAEASAAKLEEAGIVTNPHTPETVYSCRAMWEVLKSVFERADESIQAQILAARDEQITPEQYKEIKEVFEYFDRDGDEALERSEFHSCATGIGVVLTDEELTEKMKQLDTTGDGVINFQEFTVFMIERLVEPGHTHADVSKAFQDLAEGDAYITPRVMKMTFQDEEVRSYLLEKMAPYAGADAIEAGSYEYDSFVTELFSR